MAEKVRKLRVHGAKVKYFHEMIGGNFRLHELQAAFLRVKLRHLGKALQKRKHNAQRLIQMLQEKWKAVFPVEQCVCEGETKTWADRTPNNVLLPYSCQKGVGEHTWNQLVIRVSGNGERDAFKEKLAQAGVQSEIYYPKAMHQQSCFGKTKEKFPAAELFCEETLALPGLNFSKTPEFL